MGAASQIPKYVAIVIKKCWPEGIVEEFDTDESYFHAASIGNPITCSS
jgi:hypothetical protein